MKIKHVFGYEILDSRGQPTIGCTIELSNGICVDASAPAGRSCGKYESPELRDNDHARYGGKGVRSAVSIIEHDIASICIDREPDVISFDKKMLELYDIKKVGANTLIACSIAMLKAQAITQKQLPCELVAQMLGVSMEKLPIPMFNMINGGVHAHNNLAFQEFLFIPKRDLLSENLLLGHSVYEWLSRYFEAKNGKIILGDECGFAPSFEGSVFPEKEALALLMEASLAIAGLEGIGIGIDVAASTFFNVQQSCYELHGKTYSGLMMLGVYKDLCSEFPIIAIEDGFAEDDWDGWRQWASIQGSDIALVADDLTVTNSVRIQEAAKLSACNAILIKPNQAATVTATLKAIQTARNEGFKIIISHRSGETEDCFIADLALGAQADYIKAGPPIHERTAKYNRLTSLARLLGIHV